MEKTINLALIGYGSRGRSLLKSVFIPLSAEDNVRVTAVCDIYADRAEEAADRVEEAGLPRPTVFTDYREAVKYPGLNAVIVPSAWESHIEVAIAAMRQGLDAAIEVGGAYSVEDCWQLVHTHEETGRHCMLLENCCYGRKELAVLNMYRKGLLGRVVHCEGGYHHDLRGEISCGKEKRHYRLRNYINRDCENYPTHELGPIAKLLDINNGNRLVSLSSFSSASAGLREYVLETKGADSPLADVEFKQGDVCTTVIKCQKGQTIVLTLDTSLPGNYSRGFTVRGTKGAFYEDGGYFYLDKVHNEHRDHPENLWGNAGPILDENAHDIWKTYKARGGHGGMDWLVCSAFIESLKLGVRPPIDTYDTATYMCISALSEQSIAMGGVPVSIPDFTRSKWYRRNDIADTYYNIDRLEPFADLYQY